MDENREVYILGGGAIGLALGAFLTAEGQKVLLVRTSTPGISQHTVEVMISDGNDPHHETVAQVDVVSLSNLQQVDGIVAVTAKSYANDFIAKQLKERLCRSPIIIMQNGFGNEKAYQDAGFEEIYRCILYSASQKTGQYAVQFKMAKSSPIGVVNGNRDHLKRCVEQLTTSAFQFHIEDDFKEEVWKKGILNAIFNTICPLLEIDNGIFARDQKVAELAGEIISECVAVANKLGIALEHQGVMDHLLKMSHGSDGQLVSTLQDIQNNRETETDSLNLEIARVAERLSSEINVGKTKLLGDLIVLKSRLRRSGQ